MELIKSAGRFLLHRCGGLRLLSLPLGSGLKILMYHNFPASERKSYERQFEFLSRRYQFVSLDQVADALRGGAALPPNPMAITVDDGYRDFLMVAHPVLKSYGIPATVFLYTDFLDGVEWPWWDKVEYACRETTVQDAEIECGQGRQVRLSLRTIEQRQASALELCDRVKELPLLAQKGFLNTLQRVLKIQRPYAPPPSLAPLSWDDVRSLAAEGVDFGAHTKSHCILSKVQGEKALIGEIVGSRRRIAEELGKEPAHFCYPNGRMEDIGERVRTIVSQAGFLSAVTTEDGFNDTETDPFLLRRIGIDPWFPDHVFRERVAGAKVLKKKLRGAGAEESRFAAAG